MGLSNSSQPLHAEMHLGLDAAHAAPDSALAEWLATNLETGLSSQQVNERRAQAGWNELAAAPAVSQWKIFASQFRSLVVWILIAAAVVSGVLSDWTDATAIVAIVILNALLGYFQEGRAEQALAGLRKLIVPTAKVIRDGQLQALPARELLPGDVIQLEAGDHVPADARLLVASGLRIQEAVLTGESAPVEKDAQASLTPETPLADRRNMIHMGCTVSAGSARAVVVGTGMRTQIGQIAGLLETHERKPTPLQRELDSVGRTLALLCLAIVAVVFLLSLWRGDNLWDGLMVAISLAVAAVPEGLPAIVTVTLALGLQRMARRNALIRKLHSVETLGCVTVICSDKTGTLTRNEMTVREIFTDGNRYHVTGTGYDPTGEFVLQAGPEETASLSIADRQPGHVPEPLRTVLQVAAVCNNARLAQDAESWQVIGDPMEGALLVAAKKAHILTEEGNLRVIGEIPFDSERKMMSVLARDRQGKTQQFTKGAPEAVLKHCSRELRSQGPVPLDETRRRELGELTDEMAGRALRVLACAFRDGPGGQNIEERDLTLAGLVGMIDPPREEVREAIAKCGAAGIRTVMITGDHPTTAVAIGRELGLLESDAIVLTGGQLDALSEADLAQRSSDIGVYARVAPAHKLRVVNALQAQRHIVAMTGDGVNDAPAVKTADIGIAMGRSGTDVTREAAAMVLLDDNFTSIVNAVEEGRAIYDNIRKILAYLLSCNIGEMLLMLIAALLGWPSPLQPIQLLWINLVTDGLPAFALAMESAEPDLMQRRPRQAHQKMLSWQLGAVVIGQGALLAIVGLAAFWIGMRHSRSVDHARTLAFNAIVFSELLRVLAARSSRSTFWQLGAVTNPYVFGAVTISILLQLSLMTWPPVRSLFEVTGHSWTEWLIVAALALVPVSLLELQKLARQSLFR